MKMLRPDVFQRINRTQAPRRRGGASVVILALCGLGLLVLSRIDHPLVHKGRMAITELVAPALQAFAVPLRPVRALAERISQMSTTAEDVQRLVEENRRLRVWEARARELERRLADLGALARVVGEPNLKFITARVIADAVGPFARTVLINAGREHGIKPGYAVIGSDGFVGRVLEAGARAARVLLLTDINSRIPVLVGTHGLRAILVGSNAAEPRLEHLPERSRITAGDEVVTSGSGGLLPRGLRLGVVSSADRGDVRPHGRLDRLEHVSVLFFDTPATELAAETPQRAPVPDAAKKPAGR